jgi:coenzyme F420-0:L-glutamate ligase / coenzyme F420-1:gamma-L-glutamate ligase
MKKIEIIGLQTVPEIQAGDNLTQIIYDCAKNENVGIAEKDIIVLTSKIVSKALGLTRKKSDVKISEKALKISKKTGKDPVWVQLILDAGHQIILVIPLKGALTNYISASSLQADDSRKLCDNEKVIFVTKSPTGRVCTCDAGIDGSNHPAGLVSLMPEDPDAEAAKIRAEFRKITGKNTAVILADTEIVPLGTIDLAVGSAGINPCSANFGKKDRFGRSKFGGIDLVAHEITAASALLFGQTSAGVPAAIIRGCDYEVSETKNIANTLHFEGSHKGFMKILKQGFKDSSYAVDRSSEKILFRIASWLIR